MAVTGPLPYELLTTIILMLIKLGGKQSSRDLLNAACASKALCSVAIPLLYRNIIVRADDHLLRALFYRLLKNKILADSVRSLTCMHNNDFPPVKRFGDKQSDDANEPLYPADFEQLLFSRFKEFGSWPPKERFQGRFAFQFLARLCPGLVELELVDYIGFPSGPLSHRLLWNDPWPFTRLEKVCVDFRDNIPGLTGHVFDGLFRAMRAGRAPVKCLECNGLNMNESDFLYRWDESWVNLTSVKLGRLNDTVQRTWRPDRYGWQTAHGFLKVCRELEEFHVEVSVLKYVTIYNNTGPLIESLKEKHRHSLKNLRFVYLSADYPSARAIKFFDPSFTQQVPPNLELTNLTMFECLETISVPLPFLFGFMLYFATEKDIIRLKSVPNPPMRDLWQLKGSLSKILPPSIRVVEIWVRNYYQSRVMAYALLDMLRHRRSELPNLRCFCVRLPENWLLDAFEGILESEDGRIAEKEGVKIEITCNEWPGELRSDAFHRPI